MLKKTIKYTDYFGTERTEELRFNLTEAELTMMQLSQTGGMQAYLEKIIQAQDAPAIMENFRQIIRKSYGVISDDGRRFIKSEELSTEFEQTEAYSQLFMELCTDPEKASEFINGIMPPKALAKLEEKASEQ